MTDQKPETVSSKSSNDNRTIGPVTIGAASGATVGASAAQITVWLLAQQGIDASPVEGALTVLATAVLGIVGGYLVRPASSRKGKHA